MSDNHRIIQSSLRGAERGQQDVSYSFVYGYSATIEKFSILICVLILLVTFGCGAITFLLNGTPSFEDPRLASGDRGFNPRGTLISSRSLSFHNFIRADLEVLSPIPHETLPYLNVHEKSEVNAAGVDVTLESRSKRQIPLGDRADRCPYPSFTFPKLVFESSDGEDLFRLSHLKSMCLLESNLMRAHPTFISECEKSDSNTNETCCPTWSLGYAIALLNNKSACEDIDEKDVERTKTTLALCSSFYLSGELTDHCKQTTCTTVPIQCKITPVVFLIFHYLLPRSFAEDTDKGLNKALSHSVSFSPIVLCEQPECLDKIDRIYKDNFTNPLLLDNGITKILGIDFFLKIRIFDELLFSDLTYVAVGVFTAFVIIWVYTRSLFITLGALLNMLMSIISATFIYYVVFGIKFFPFANIVSCVLVIGIGADDTFVYVDLWRAAKDKIGRGKENRVLVLERATRHAFVTLLVTSLTTSSALYATIISYVTVGKCFGVFAGTALVANFVYTITWLPAIIVIHDKYFLLESEERNRHFAVSCFRRIGSALLSIPRAFFRKVLPKLIVTLRFVWIPIFLLVGIAGFVLTFVYPRLELQESGELKFFQDEHPFERYDQVYKGGMGFESDVKNTLPITFIWGVKPTINQNQWDPLDFGTLELDPNFSIGSKETQTWLFEFCERIKELSFYDGGSENDENYFCFIDSFTTWMNRTCGHLEDRTCCEQDNFPFLENVFHKCVVNFAVFRCQNYPCLRFTPGLRFDKNNSLNGLYLNFPSSVSYTLMFEPIEEFWNNLLSWTEEQILSAPEGLKGGWSFSERDLQVPFYDLQTIVVESTVFTILISLGAAMIVLLLTTQNILLTLYAILTITLSVASVVGCVVLLGWQLNIFEAMTFSLAVGLSVDFTIHYGVAFKLAPVDDRKGRTLYAIETLSSPITAAALSTFSAGAAMIPATIINYTQIGVFLTLIMTLSWLFSTFFFCSLCVTVGPDGTCGQLRRPRMTLKTLRKTGIDNPHFEVGNG